MKEDGLCRICVICILENVFDTLHDNYSIKVPGDTYQGIPTMAAGRLNSVRAR